MNKTIPESVLCTYRLHVDKTLNTQAHQKQQINLFLKRLISLFAGFWQLRILLFLFLSCFALAKVLFFNISILSRSRAPWVMMSSARKPVSIELWNMLCCMPLQLEFSEKSYWPYYSHIICYGFGFL